MSTDSTNPRASAHHNSPGETPLRLAASMVRQIEAALAEVGEFGEVHLVVVKGRVRFVKILRSLDAENGGGR